MVIYNKDNIKVSTIEENDKEKVLKYFSENTFNCDYESGALRPSNYEFLHIMDEIIAGNDEENILVLKKDDEVIGYEAMHAEYDRIVIGHIAVDKNERKKGYGELLTHLAILIAENEDRDVSLFCEHRNKYFGKYEFETSDNIHYLYRRKGIKTEGIPTLFVSVDEYRIRAEKKREEHLDKFKKTMELMKKLDLHL